ncbi:MAG: hypothetical protein ABIQ31_27535 [Ferruginibacter sp.]
MKKTFTFLAIAVLSASALFAQNNSRDNNYGGGRGRDVVVNDRGGNGYGRDRGTYYFTAKERDTEIFSIRREYGKRIESVRHKLFMGRSKKEQLICSLELQRDSEIRSVIEKFNDRKNLFGRDNRHDDDNHDRRHKW